MTPVDGVAPFAARPPVPLAGDDVAALARLGPDEAARKFEGLFASLLLSEAKKTLPSGSFFGGGPGADVYDGLLERLFGERLAEQGGFGLADFVRADLARREGAATPPDAAPATPATPAVPTAPPSLADPRLLAAAASAPAVRPRSLP